MKTLIIYDSFFGNTEQIAQAIGQAIGTAPDVQVLRITNVTHTDLTRLDLLIVGSPTRGFRPTPAIADFLKAIPVNSLKGVRIAAFDTRIALEDIEKPIFRPLIKLGGYAAKPMAEILIKKGAVQRLPPEGFYVNGEKGPLKEGELERAAAWARKCALINY
jgi:flavodoxin I